VGAKLVNLPWEGVAGYQVDIRVGTWHRLWFVTTSRHMEGRRERPQDGFGQIAGSADPRAALFAPVFVQVTDRWVPRSIWGCLRCF
jgi:hypothetical protein